MKRNFNWILANIFVIATLMLPVTAFCQLGDPEGDPDAPIDGGVGVLVAAGVAYGIKKAGRRKQNSSTARFGNNKFSGKQQQL
jgi:hypothetical protein